MLQKSTKQRLFVVPAYAETIPEFLSQHSCYYEAAIESCFHPINYLYTCELDRIEFYFRSFIAGNDFAILAALENADTFIAMDELVAREMIQDSLKNVREYILKKEWFELMERYNLACQRIQAEFNLSPPTRPLTL